jgi:leucyl aminopeptidase (aminopeptidase T)
VLADGLITAHPASFDKLYQDALEIDYAALSRTQDRIEAALRSGTIRITTPAGTKLEMRMGSRPMNKQNGDASARHMRDAKVRVDREVELPAGVVRVAPEETTVNGTWVIPEARFDGVVARNIRFQIKDGSIVKTDVGENREAVERALKAGGPSALRFREIGIGANPKLALPRGGYPGGVIPYFAYGSGVLRMSLGDNEELGGAVRGGFRRWFFFPDATVESGAGAIVRSGKLVVP